MTSAKFCPRCGSPIQSAPDPSRLCGRCGWFGDKKEVLKKPPPCDEFNPMLAAAQALELYRDVCRQELIVEQIYDAGNATEADLRKVRVMRQEVVHSLIEMFVKLRNRPGIEP